MDLLVALRALTLTGWIALAIGTLYIVVVYGRRLSPAHRGAWWTVAVRHCVVALTTVFVEATSVARAVQPASSLALAGKALYNPAYLLNATVSAMLPFVLIALLAYRELGRRAGGLTAAGVALFAICAVAAGAPWDWSVLMAWTQGFAFLEIAGYLILGGLMVLGYLRRMDPYLLGILVITALYTVLLPIQAEFFKLVGRRASNAIWHLNQFLQLVVVVTALVAVLAYIARLRNRRPTDLVAIGADPGTFPGSSGQ
jgi:hypothetical protein